MTDAEKDELNASIHAVRYPTDAFALAERGYKIGEKIGEGSYATVITAGYVFKDGREVQLACKIIDRKKAPPEFVNKFLPRELDILMKLDHPHIIQIHSILQRGPKIFIFMRYAERGDLLNFIKDNGPVGEPRAKIWFRQMAEALEYLHSKNVAHRDLKCENVLLTEHFNVKLADFGFSRFCADTSGKKAQSETYCGSAAYAAPEVIAGDPYDPTISDTWSLGIILFVILNGKMPFDDSHLTRLILDQRNKRYSFLPELEEQLSPDVIAAVTVLLEPEPEKRWTATEVLNCNWLTANDQKNLPETS